MKLEQSIQPTESMWWCCYIRDSSQLEPNQSNKQSMGPGRPGFGYSFKYKGMEWDRKNEWKIQIREGHSIRGGVERGRIAEGMNFHLVVNEPLLS